MVKTCDCMGQIHPLVNNCLGCGRVVCELEGEGPCVFCGNIVLKNENIDLEAEQQKLMRELDTDPGLCQTYFVAVEHKAKLLTRDKEKNKTKNVIDEDMDWYDMKDDVWQSDQNRKIAVNQMLELEDEEAEARENVITSFDFNKGAVNVKKIDVNREKHRKMIEDMMQQDEDAHNLELKYMEMQKDSRLKEKDQEILEAVQKTYQKQTKEKEEKVEEKPRVKSTLESRFKEGFSKRVDNDDCYSQFLKAIEKKDRENQGLSEEDFDRVLFNMTGDDTKCLSMWQPWASLLIYGFKRFEGRLWDTNYRGPLWIHAGAKEPDESLIASIENQYRRLYEDVPDMPEFPTSYPTGCIIGAVDLQDVIDQKAYTETVPKRYTGESTQKNIFVVRNPRKLMVNIKCVGNKGIFDLDPQMIATAVQTMKSIPTSWFPYYADKLPSARILEDGEYDEEEIEQSEEPAAAPEPPKKTVEVVDCSSNYKSIELTGDTLTKIEDFITAYEKANYKRLEKGKDGALRNIPLNENLAGFEKLKAALISITQETYEISKERAVNTLLKTIDVFAVSKVTRTFDFPRNYSLLLIVGKKLDLIPFYNNQGKMMKLGHGTVLAGINQQTTLQDIRFVKVPKDQKLADYQCQKGETLVVGCY